MYTYIMQRTQIYLSESETAALDAEARETGHTRSHLIREAIRARYRTSLDVEERLAILRTASGAWADREMTGAEYVEAIRKPGFDERLTELWGHDERGRRSRSV
jgi:hypothetical protein